MRGNYQRNRRKDFVVFTQKNRCANRLSRFVRRRKS